MVLLDSHSHLESVTQALLHLLSLDDSGIHILDSGVSSSGNAHLINFS